MAHVTVLDCGTFRVGAGLRDIGIPAFLLTTDRGAQVLVDGGFPPVYGRDAAGAAAADGLAAFGELLGYGPGNSVAAQLARCGVAVGDLAAHVLTHGHIDHVGALPLIHCPLILTEIERGDPRPSYFRSARPVSWPKVPTLTLCDEADLCPGIRLIPTPGHTAGHLSLLLTPLAGPPLLIAGDAINRASEPEEGFPDASDPSAARQSADRLFALCRDLGAKMLYGHDPRQWQDWPKAPERLV